MPTTYSLGLKGVTPSLRGDQENPINIDPQYMGFLDRLLGAKGLHLDRPGDQIAVKSLLEAAKGGAYTPDQLDEFSQRNPGVASIIKPTSDLLKNQIARQQQMRGIMSSSFAQEGAMGEQYPDDIKGAVSKLYALGTPDAVDMANKILEGQAKQGKGFYGGIQTGEVSPGNYQQYTFSELTGQPVPLNPPHGVRPTLPMQLTQAQGPQGTVYVQTPTRGVPGSPMVATPTGLTPSREQDVQELANKVQTSRIGALIPIANKLDSLISTAETSGGKLPGIGYAKNTKMSTFLKTPDGRFVTSLVQNLFNEDLRQMSGVAVPIWEEARQKVAYALRPDNSVDDFIRVYKEVIKPRMQSSAATLIGGYGPNVLDLYEGRQKQINLREFVKESNPKKSRTQQLDELMGIKRD